MHHVAQAAPQVQESRAPFQSTPDSSMPGPDFSSQGMQQTLQMMRQNPALMEQMRNTLSSMTPEQMQAAVSPSLLHCQRPTTLIGKSDRLVTDLFQQTLSSSQGKALPSAWLAGKDGWDTRRTWL